MWWPGLGAIVVGFGGLIDPHVLGAGYDSIEAPLGGSMLLRAIVLLLAVEAIVWLAALGSGTSGGILAPLLMLGGALAALAEHWLPGGVRLYAGWDGADGERLDARAVDRDRLRDELNGRLYALPVAAGRASRLMRSLCWCCAGPS